MMHYAVLVFGATPSAGRMSHRRLILGNNPRPSKQSIEATRNTMNEPPAGRDYLDESFIKNAAIVLTGSYFDGCDFDQMRFADTSLRRSVFQDCRFVGCDLSRLRVDEASFRDCSFLNCRMMGIDWSALGGLVFSIRLRECNARFSLFDELNMKWCSFSDTDLSECSFQNTDLSGLKFDGCDLSRSGLNGAKLIGTDLSGATGISLEPGRCQLRATRINMDTAVATLEDLGLIIG